MTMPLDEQYFNWLYQQVASVRLRNPTRTYWSLLRLLHAKEYVWVIANDDNRLEDGRSLRDEFLAVRNLSVETQLTPLRCSMLEMLISLSRRIVFEADGEVSGWFWELMGNLGISEYTDSYFTDRDEQTINDILDRMIWRNYDYSGSGGLFPLCGPYEDQRKVELWYQLSVYLLERE